MFSIKLLNLNINSVQPPLWFDEYSGESYVMDQPLTLRVLNTQEQIEEIEPEWNNLVFKVSENPFFLTDFVIGYMDMVKDWEWRPIILAFYDKDQLVGITPLKNKRVYGISYTRFLYLDDCAPDFIAEKEYREICVEYSINYILNDLKSDIMDLILPEESESHKLLMKVYNKKNLFHIIYDVTKSSIIDIDKSWEEFTRFRGRKFRKNIRYIENRLNKNGNWKILIYEDKDKIINNINDIQNIENKSWKHEYRKKKGRKIDKEVELFLKTITKDKSLEQYNWALMFLELNNIKIAHAILIYYKNKSIIWKTSFNNDYQNFSPGKYLLNESVKEMFNKPGIELIDFLTNVSVLRTWTSNKLNRIRILASRGLISSFVVRLIQIWRL